MRRFEDEFNEVGRRFVDLQAENDKDLIEIMKYRFLQLDRELYYYHSIPDGNTDAKDVSYLTMRQLCRYGREMFPQCVVVEDTNGNILNGEYTTWDEDNLRDEDDDY